MSTCPVMQKWDDNVWKKVSYSSSKEINSRHTQTHFRKQVKIQRRLFCCGRAGCFTCVRTVAELSVPHDRERTGPDPCCFTPSTARGLAQMAARAAAGTSLSGGKGVPHAEQTSGSPVTLPPRGKGFSPRSHQSVGHWGRVSHCTPLSTRTGYEEIVMIADTSVLRKKDSKQTLLCAFL